TKRCRRGDTSPRESAASWSKRSSSSRTTLVSGDERMLHVAVVAMLLVFQDQHAAVVHGDTGTIEVTLHNDSASVRLSTPGRAFQLDWDWLTLAAWADTAAAKRGPRKGAKETEFPAARLATSLVSMAIIRLSTDPSASYAFMAAGYGGLSARIILPHDSAMRL